MAPVAGPPSPGGKTPGKAATVLGVLLCAFTLAEVNYSRLGPQAQLAVFAALGLVLSFLHFPSRLPGRWAKLGRPLDLLLAAASVACCGYILVQTDRLTSSLWIGGQSLGNRAGQETHLDIVVGTLGLILVLEGTRRAIGWTLPLLASAAVAYAFLGPQLPSWLLPHRGYDLDRIVSQTFLNNQGVFGVALRVMFTYVFLFVVFGALLEATGATGFIIRLARRVFRRSTGGAAKVAVFSSGLMGSLSGSAVANTATTGTFTIPMMRSAGFPARVAGGIEAAASSGGALMPPVMGAAAYMMLEIVPGVTYTTIIRAALLPALLYYFSLLLIVHFYALRVKGKAAEPEEAEAPLPVGESGAQGSSFPGWLFVAALGVLVVLLLLNFTPFRAVSLAMLAVVLLGAAHPETRLGPRRLLAALAKTSKDVVPLVTAASAVGVIIGVVTLTGVGTRLPALVLPLAQDNLVLALIVIMISSIVLGMGLPSAVCYLLMATLMGSALGQMGVVPLAAHFFIFYFGMMSMVTPPVALAAYAAASIAGSRILATGVSAFSFALVGFTLPFLFVFRPELLWLSPDGGTPAWTAIAVAVLVAVLGIVPLAAGIAGHLFGPLSLAQRVFLLVSAVLFLLPASPVSFGGMAIPVHDLAGAALLLSAGMANKRAARGADPAGS